MHLTRLLEEPRAAGSLALLIVGTVLGAWAVVRPRWQMAAAALASAGVTAWLLTNGPVEGRVLLVPLQGNGLTEGDLPAAPAAVCVLYLVVRSLRR